jgi:hypothetical protein
MLPMARTTMMERHITIAGIVERYVCTLLAKFRIGCFNLIALVSGRKTLDTH